MPGCRSGKSTASIRGANANMKSCGRRCSTSGGLNTSSGRRAGHHKNCIDWHEPNGNRLHLETYCRQTGRNETSIRQRVAVRGQLVAQWVGNRKMQKASGKQDLIQEKRDLLTCCTPTPACVRNARCARTREGRCKRSTGSPRWPNVVAHVRACCVVRHERTNGPMTATPRRGPTSWVCQSGRESQPVLGTSVRSRRRAASGSKRQVRGRLF